MQIFRSKPRTPDAELAANIRAAAAQYNNAVQAALAAGLTVSSRAYYAGSSYGYEYIGSRKIGVTNVVRNKSVAL